MLEFSPLCLNRLQKSDILDDLIDYVDSIHLDIMDGIFVPNTAFTVSQINDFACTIPKHIHIMSFDPLPYIKSLNDVDSISIHYEIDNCIKHIQEIKSKNIRAGIVINPSTPIESIYDLIDDLDRVILMAVEPGYSGQNYLTETSLKLKKLRKFSPEIEIVIDGGMNDNTIKVVKDLGADSFVICSVVVKSNNIIQKIAELKSIWNN
jgi:ribulose-phosphate 3-epimerase